MSKMRDRKYIASYDVADAIGNIAERNGLAYHRDDFDLSDTGTSLALVGSVPKPLAIRKKALIGADAGDMESWGIVETLTEMYFDGDPNPGKRMKELMMADIEDQLEPLKIVNNSTGPAVERSSIFKEGYKTYERITKNRTFPINADKLFGLLKKDETVLNFLEALEKPEILDIMPARAIRQWLPDGSSIMVEGKTTGIIIFPHEYAAANLLVKAFDERYGRGVRGAIIAHATRIAMSAPDYDQGCLTQAAIGMEENIEDLDEIRIKRLAELMRSRAGRERLRDMGYKLEDDGGEDDE